MDNIFYVVDSDYDVIELVKPFMEQEGYRIRSFSDGETLIPVMAEHLPDLVILDAQMPGMDALSVCSLLRKKYPALPIIIISDKNDPLDRVTGFTLGCDDYLSKPFLPLELIARIRALLRRCSAAEKTEGSTAFVFGPLTLYPERRQALHGGEPFSLTPSEFDFILYLIQHSNSAVSRDELIRTLWNMNWNTDTRVTDDLVKRLRRKLRLINSPVKIETVWGFGFRIDLEDTSDEAASPSA